MPDYNMYDRVVSDFETAIKVRESICVNCRGVPQADWLPFWVYDEFDECLCPRLDPEPSDEALPCL